MSRFVRQSKYRHVFGTGNSKPEGRYSNLKITNSAWDSNIISANPLFFSICLNAGGGGAFTVVPLERTGKLPTDLPVYNGHSAQVLDTAFHPFNDYIVASCGEDTTVKLWNIPEGGLTENVSDCLVSLSGHGRKVGGLSWHPSANNVLASSSTDATIKLWDVEAGAEKVSLKGFGDHIQDFSWSGDGSQIVAVAKDKKIRLLDPRSGEVTQTGDSHKGIKGCRVEWCVNAGYIFTVGFGRMSDRQYRLYDPTNLAEPLTEVKIDQSSGIIMPFLDDDSNCIYLAGKGDGNIRYLELVPEKPFAFNLSEYKSSDPQRGMCALPKRAVNTTSVEVMRLLKVGKGYVEPVSMRVPRKVETFQEDLYPECVGGEAAISAEDFFGGANALPKRISLKDGYTAPAKQAFKVSAAASAAANAGASTSTRGGRTVPELEKENAALKKEIADLKNQLAARDAKINQLEAQ